MGRLPERSAFRRRHARHRQPAERKETATNPDAAAPENELRVEFGRILFDLIRYDLMEEITASLSHVFDEFVEYGCMERPSVKLLENKTLHPYEFASFLFGESLGRVRYYEKGSIHKLLPQDVRNTAVHNFFIVFKKSRLPESYISMKEQENSREACLFLYRYFQRVEDDRQQAFHWLKKLAVFGVPEDLQKLSAAYRKGDGCHRDKYLSDKYHFVSGRSPGQQKDLF